MSKCCTKKPAARLYFLIQPIKLSIFSRCRCCCLGQSQIPLFVWSRTICGELKKSGSYPQIALAMCKKTWFKGNDLFLEMYAIRYVLEDDLHYRRATVHGLINYPVNGDWLLFNACETCALVTYPLACSRVRVFACSLTSSRLIILITPLVTSSQSCFYSTLSS